MPMTILRRLEIISSYQFVVILKFVKISCIFIKYAVKINRKLEKISNLHRIVMDIKRQNQSIKLGQNCQIKFCSFQLMEGNPSIRWQYFHRLEAFHLLAFGYNCCRCPCKVLKVLQFTRKRFTELHWTTQIIFFILR